MQALRHGADTVAEVEALAGHLADAAAYLALAQAILSACAGAISGLCGLVNVLPHPVGTALEVGSDQMRQLPPWPRALPVLDAAGDMNIQIGIDGLGSRLNLGDGAVTLGSATGHHTAGPPAALYCTATALPVGFLLSVQDPGPCFHTHLARDQLIISAVLAAIRANLPPVCPSAAAIKQALPARDREIRGNKGQIKRITCVGPYVTADLVYSPQIGTVVLLKQEATGLKYLTAGTGPRCTIIRADGGGGVVYVPPQYGHALLCVDGNRLAAEVRDAVGSRATFG